MPSPSPFSLPLDPVTLGPAVKSRLVASVDAAMAARA